MTTGQDLVNASLTFLGEPYSTAPGRTSPTSGFKDCSGLIAASYEVATGLQLGAYVSVTIYDLCAGTWGLGISREAALGIAGACLLIPDDPYQGWGSNGHIGFSAGDGTTVEATPPRVQRLPNTYQPWGPLACLLPGINYGDDMAEVDLTLKALNDVRNVVGGDPNLDGTAVVLSQIVRDLMRIEQKVDKLVAGGGSGPTSGTWTTT